MTPKSLLRNKFAASPLNELSEGFFKTVVGEVDINIDFSKVKRALVCSGKIYYDLVNTRKEKKQFEVVIIRIEQLYPFPHKAFTKELKNFPNLKEVIWVQDEPQNQGAWYQIQHNIFENLVDGQKLAYTGRPASASPAVGYYDKHYLELKSLLEAAFSKLKGFMLVK